MSAPRPSAEPGAGTSGLPERLRERRRAAGLSQAELAEGIVDPSYISLLEAGRRTPTPDVVAALAARLGVSTSQLVGDELEGLDEAATLAHKETEHYKVWRETVADLMATPRKTDKFEH